ncbi:hypothetical protein [Mycobacteroides stephanolepidis]|uniref:hypothetical protein n=1 Tax=[Mycobacterium] stephanolepidis TaxID=1520670 RepID=UPI001E44B4C6|nr:hypothetical protein [[Mycobacterium] stephanolepidis]
MIAVSVAAAMAVSQSVPATQQTKVQCSVQADTTCDHSGDPHLTARPNPGNMVPRATIPQTKTRPSTVLPRA